MPLQERKFQQWYYTQECQAFLETRYGVKKRCSLHHAQMLGDGSIADRYSARG